MENQNINSLIDLDLSILSITLIVERKCPAKWVHEQKTSRSDHGLVYILDGSALFSISQGQFTVRKGDIVFLPIGSIYSTTADASGHYSFIVVSFRLNNDEIFKTYAIGVIEEALNKIHYKSIFRDLSNTWYSKGIAHKVKCKGILHHLLFLLISSSIQNRLHTKNLAKIKPAISFLEENYTTNIDIDHLAALSQLSATHFRRLFKEAYGISPLAYLNSLRISKAKDLILSNMYTVGEIAEKVGFPDICYFSRAFKKATGKCPTDFQKELLE